MKTSILTTFAAATLGLALFVTSASARDHRHGGFWWESSGSYGAYGDEYSYPGIRWYGDADCGYGRGYGYRERRGGHRRGGRRHGHHRGEWRYDRERNDWR